MIYSFAGYEVDTDRIEVRHEGAAVHVEPQVFDVLCYLIENRDRVVTKIELFEQVWDGAFVGESALTSRIKTARRLVGDDGRAQRVIRTVQRRGYQFVADVLERTGSDPAPSSTAGADLIEHPAPSGTISFLFSDIEGSSRLWEDHADLMDGVITRHDRLLHEAIEASGGTVFATAGDGMAAAFSRASDAVDAARRIRAGLDDEQWPDPIRLGVRLGVHTGEAIERNGDYLGAAVNRAARVMGAAHAGQIVISDVTAGILADDGNLVDLGVCQIDPAMPAMRLWQVDGGSFPPPAGAIAAALPTLRTELIGRERDLEAVVDAVAEHRLVSVVGPGGAGKTTLALAASNTVLVAFPAGVIFVELASVTDGGGIFRAVAETAGIEGVAATDMASLAKHLARRPVLLVLDNCEHLLDACADFIDAVLDTGQEATILTTSREPLGVDGEIVLPLGSLEDHGPELFVTRARASRSAPGIDVDDPQIADLCRRLDGLPLAIELAAAQLQHLGLEDLVDRLDASLELSGGGRTRGRGRHVTLERTIAWSYDLLDDGAQWLLRQFGIFPGTFDLAAARAVGRQPEPSVLPALSDLISKSLVVRDASTGRYRLLETIRAFASQRLAAAGESESAGERLRCHLVERATSLSRLDRWLSGENAALLRADLDNVRFAFDRSMSSGRHVDALEIHVSCCFLFRNTLSCTDGRRWATRLEPAEGDLDVADRLWATLVRADVAQGTADHRAGASAATTALELAERADDEPALVLARLSEAMHHVVADPAAAQSRLDAALEVALAFDDRRLEQLLRAFCSVTALAAGDVERGMEIADVVGHEVDGDGYEVFIANWAAWTACLIRQDATGLRYWRQRQRGYLTRIGVPEPWMFLWSTALVAAMEGDDPTDGLRLARERAESEGHDVTADIVLGCAVVERHRRGYARAAELLGVVMGRRLNNLSHYVLVRTLMAEVGAELGESELRVAMDRGTAMAPADALAAHGLG